MITKLYYYVTKIWKRLTAYCELEELITLAGHRLRTRAITQQIIAK